MPCERRGGEFLQGIRNQESGIRNQGSRNGDQDWITDSGWSAVVCGF